MLTVQHSIKIMFMFLRYTWSISFVRWIGFLWTMVWMFLSAYHETLSLTSLPFPHFWLGKKKKKTTNMVFCSQGLILSLNGLVLFIYDSVLLLFYLKFWKHEINRMEVLQHPRRICRVRIDWIIVSSFSLLRCYRIVCDFIVSPTK